MEKGCIVMFFLSVTLLFKHRKFLTSKMKCNTKNVILQLKKNSPLTTKKKETQVFKDRAEKQVEHTNHARK